MLAVDLSSVLCSSDVTARAVAISVAWVLVLSAAAAFAHLRKRAADCGRAGERLQLAERALQTQAECHSRDAERTGAEIAALVADVDDLTEHMYRTRQHMRALKAEGEAHLAENDKASSRMGRVGAEVEELAMLLDDKKRDAEAETNSVLAAEIAARGAVAELRVHVAEEKWRCERQVTLASARADDTIRRAMGVMDANRAHTPAKPTDEDSAEVKSEQARAAVSAYARLQHLQRSSAAVCDEVSRVWGVEVMQLQNRAKANAIALEALNAEAEKIAERDALVGAWSEVNERNAAVIVEAESAEDAVWEQSVAASV
jgi:hypothetical protein